MKSRIAARRIGNNGLYVALPVQAVVCLRRALTQMDHLLKCRRVDTGVIHLVELLRCLRQVKHHL